MTRYEKTIDIDAPPATVWAVIADVERWPESTPTMKPVKRREPGPLALDSTAEVDVDGAGKSTLRVTEYTGRPVIHLAGATSAASASPPRMLSNPRGRGPG